jgi:Predicted membrane-bound mannosyltransferase
MRDKDQIGGNLYMSKLCIKCGAELEDQAIFCDECGAKQETITNKSEEPLTQRQLNEQKNNMKQSGMGIVSFILGIISVMTFGVFFLPEILGIIFGILGRQDKTKKTGMATTGFVLSLLAVVMWLFLFWAA